jgi:hypothetical protein
MRSSVVLASTLFALAPRTGFADCSTFAAFQEGTVATMGHYDKKGKLESTTKTTTISAKPSGLGRAAMFRSEMLDAKGKSVQSIEFDATCSGDRLQIDMRAFLTAGTFQGRDGYDSSFVATNLEYPATPVAGAALADGQVRVRMTMKDAPPGMPSNLTTSQFELKLTDRKVVGPESVTTPAGTFEAWKIEYDANGEMASVVNTRFTSHVTEWYVPGTGVVKSSSAGRDGKVNSTSELIAFARK